MKRSVTTLSDEVKKNIIRTLITNNNYRDEVVALLDARFIAAVKDFLMKILHAKQHYNGSDWYEKTMLDPKLPREDISWNSGLNLKTISNIYQSATKKIVIDASRDHYHALKNVIESVSNSKDLKIEFNIISDKTDVSLTPQEALIVINALSVRRAGMRGGLWSTVGKKVEKPLIKTLCKLLKVPTKHYDQSSAPTTLRETDFHLFKDTKNFKCEVKLMGRGNPEGADTTHWRDTKIFVGDKLSDINKLQLTKEGIHWVAMYDGNVLEQFASILEKLGIPYTKFSGNLEVEVDKVLKDL